MKRKILLFICIIITVASWAGKPTIPTAINITNTSADITWGNNTCGTNNYTLQYKETSAASWTIGTTILNIANSSSTTYYSISALIPNTAYLFRVNCGGNWQVVGNFSTLSSSACAIFNTIITTNTSCSNTLDGSIDLTTTGGSPPYIYNWDNGSSTKDLTGIGSGLYIVTTTDTAGCTKIDSITVDFNNTKSLTQTVPIFIDTSNLNYPGIIDGHNIWAYDTISITNTGCDVNIRPEFIISHNTQAILQGQIVIHWHNGFGYNPITYNIDSNGNAYGYWGYASGINLTTQTTQEMAVRVKFQSSAPYGEYTSSWETFEIDNAGNKIQPALSSPSPSSINLVNCSTFEIDSTNLTNINCNGLGNGSATIFSLANGSGQYTYNWNNGQNTAIATNLVAGTYYCLVTDINWGCTDSVNIILTEPAIINASLTGTDITCNGNNDGTLSGLATGGSGSYKFTWNPILTPSNTQTSLPASLYTLNVLDLVCGTIDSTSFNINEPNLFQENTTSTNNTSCDSSNCNGSINISILGGTSPYSIIWANGDSAINKNDVCNGSYSITITDANFCATFTENITISDNPSIPSVSTSVLNNSSCDSTLCNGSILLIENSGATPYSILWNTGSTTNTLSSLCGNSYSYTITDTNSCILNNTIAVYDSATTPNIGLISTNISCNGITDGTAEASILSGSGSSGTISTLTYCTSGPGMSDYSNIEFVRLIGDGDSIVNNTNGMCDTYDDFTSQHATLTPGQTYSIDVNLGTCHPTFGFTDGGKVFIDWNIDGDFDDLGEEVGSIAVTQSPSTNTLSFTAPNLGFFGATRMRVISQYGNSIFTACEQGNSNPFTAPYYGATEDYSIVINGSIPTTYLWSSSDTTAQITNLSIGTYICTVYDTSGCYATDSITITEPSAINTLENTTNVLCNNEINGTVSLMISGGNYPYSSNWGTADTTALAVGIYNYSITDNNGCTYSDSVNISEPSAIINSYTSINANCNGNNTGSIDISLSGGIPPFTFLWNNGDTTEDLTNISAGQYIVNITDVNNCTLNDTINISEPDLLYANYTQTNVTCNGGIDGSAIVNFFGGVTDYTFSWGTFTYPLSGGISFFQTPMGIPAGIYPFTVTDSNSCIFSDTITITEPDSIQTTATLTSVSCKGENNGSAILVITGGTSPYLESWGVSDSSALISGYHSFTITDANGCINSDSILIIEPTTLTVSEIISNISCNGFSDGYVTLNITGGTAPYLENWGLSDSTALISGFHSFTITDANGCINSDSILITEPAILSATAITTSVLCNGDSTGTAVLIITGGSAGYIESWNGTSAYNLSANTHLFTVTDTNGCIYTDSVIINEPNLLSSSIIPTDLTSCLITNGSINLNVSGGLQSYTYLWNNNDTTENISNLSAGNYSVIITDANGCTTTNNVTVNQPSNGLTLSLISPDYSGFNISCYDGNNGTITTNTTGGAGNLIFTWSTTDTIQNLNNLSAGDYSLVVTDSVGCSLADSISLTEPLLLSSNYTSTNVTCNGLANGSAIVNFNGGIQDYILTWGTYTYPLIGGLSTFTTPIGVPAGIYPYTVTDMNGCSQPDTITIEQPDSLYSNLTLSNFNGNNISCNGFSDGSIDILVNGGTASYTYYFNGSLTSNTSFSGLSSGTYTDSIIDFNGCVFTETITLTEPDILNSILSTSNMSCNGICDGTINTQIIGGTAPYTYFSNNLLTTNNLDSLCLGNYALSITDNNSCTLNDSITITEPSVIAINLDSSINISIYGGNDGELYTFSNGGSGNLSYQWAGPSGFNATNSNITNLVAGTYFLTATDSTLCAITASFLVTQPPSLIADLDSAINLDCNSICTGELYITAYGGDSAYTYLWFGPNGYTSTNEDIDSLCAGIYTLELSDTTNTVTLYFEIIEPSPVTIISIVDTAICYNGTAQANAYVYGGNYPYQTLWSNGSTNTSTILSVGTHSVTITDTNGCISTENIIIHQQDSISISSTINNISCSGLQDASVILNITNGGTGPFQYSSNNGVTFQNSNSFYNLGSGNHLYLVLDANGCSNYISVFISAPNALLSTINHTNASCFRECDGTATITSTGGTIPYGYDWGTANPNNLCAGLYNVITTDANGCLTTDVIIISEPNPIIVNISQSVNIIEATSGFINYQWYNTNGNAITGATTDTFLPILQGEYYVEVVDSNGCTGTSLSIFIVINLIGENEIELNIFPNPTIGKITIKSTEQPNTISVINSIGNRIIFLDNNSTFEKQTIIDLSSFAKGFYFIQIELNNQLINHRVILQ